MSSTRVDVQPRRISDVDAARRVAVTVAVTNASLQEKTTLRI